LFYFNHIKYILTLNCIYYNL
ncbi:hypothetical protein, partial [Plasmodium yoelii yoelii]